MKCVIIDDEPLAIQVLSKHLKRTEGVTLVKSFQNAFEALYFIQTQHVDLVFLDIQMPGVSGLQFIRILKFPPKIIVVSAYQEYALEALELGVVDYLLKPVNYERFLTAISKAFDKIVDSGTPAGISDRQADNYFFLKDGNKHIKVLEKEILFLSGDRNYCTLHLSGKSYKLSGNLNSYRSKLPSNFIRVHKSYIVSLDKIDQYDQETLWVASAEIPIGRTYKSALMEILESKHI